MTLALSPGGRRYGYRRDTPSHLDLGISNMPSFIRTSNNSDVVVDLEPFCGPVKDQGQLGACTAFAGCGMREYLARKMEKSDVILSPLYLYWKEREFDNDLGQGDTGSFGRTSVHVMNMGGVCQESVDPYDIADFERAPTPEQVVDAGNYRAGAYHRISNVQDMKSCLASSYVFVVGFTVYQSFESMGGDHVYQPDTSKEDILGGHEVLFIGFDDSRQAFKVRNSWSSSWGNGGNFWFPYAVAADPNVLMDAWIQHMGRAW